MILLSLDLSTTCTGWAKFDMKSKKLLEYGMLKPILKGKSLLSYPELQVCKIRNLCEQILTLIDVEVSQVVIEEINRGVNRLSQKTLDGLHFILLDKFPSVHLQTVVFVDSDGAIGWRSRTGLGLQLTASDKENNKNIRKLNKKLSSKQQQPVITQKHLACRFVNKMFKLELDCDIRKTDADIADAIGLGWFYLNRE